MFAMNIVFIIIFTFEALVKISSMGWMAYWADSWNKFDFFIVCLSLFGKWGLHRSLWLVHTRSINIALIFTCASLCMPLLLLQVSASLPVSARMWCACSVLDACCGWSAEPRR